MDRLYLRQQPRTLLPDGAALLTSRPLFKLERPDGQLQSTNNGKVLSLTSATSTSLSARKPNMSRLNISSRQPAGELYSSTYPLTCVGDGSRRMFVEPSRHDRIESPSGVHSTAKSTATILVRQSWQANKSAGFTTFWVRTCTCVSISDFCDLI